MNEHFLLPFLSLTSTFFQYYGGLVGGWRQVEASLSERFQILRGRGGEPSGVGSVKVTGRRGKKECERVGWMDGESKRDRCL